MTKPTALTEAELNSDADLLSLFCRHRDEAAFAELVRRHGSMVLGVCYQTLRHRQDAQDAFQATFLVLATRAPAIKKEGSLASWLYKVAYRTAMRAAKYRRGTNLVSMPEDIPIDSDPLTTIHHQSLQLALHEELSQMPATYQQPVILCYFEGKTRKQAAEELRCSDASVKAKLTRAKQMLRTRLSRRGIALSVAMTSCSAGITATAQAASPDLFRATVAGCCASLGTKSFTFSASVNQLVTKSSTMTAIPTTTKYLTFACLSGLALLGIAWATNVSNAQDSIQAKVIQLQLGDEQEYSEDDETFDDQLNVHSTQLVGEKQDFSLFMGIKRMDNQETQKLKEQISYAEKKFDAYSMLRDAELARAELAKDAPSKIEAKAKAKLHEAEADKLASEIRELKAKVESEAIDVHPMILSDGTRDGLSLEPVPCCRVNNLAYGRTVTVSSQEEAMNNLAQLAVDGDLSTRWCADSDLVGEWIQLDLGAPKDISGIRIHWEMMDSKYSYKIETSTDGDTWTQAVDTSDDPKNEHMPEHELSAKETQFIRITFLGNSDSFWSSIREIEVTDSELSERPVEAWEKVRDDASGFEVIDLMMLLDV